MEIEAVQWLGSSLSWALVLQLLGDTRWRAGPMGTDTFSIFTEGMWALVRENEWVIKSGDIFYTMEDCLFGKFYEEVE